MNRAECGDGEDREEQGTLTASLASIMTWARGGEVPESSGTVNKEEGGIWGQKGHQRQKLRGWNQGSGRPEKGSVCSRKRVRSEGEAKAGVMSR